AEAPHQFPSRAETVVMEYSTSRGEVVANRWSYLPASRQLWESTVGSEIPSLLKVACSGLTPSELDVCIVWAKALAGRQERRCLLPGVCRHSRQTSFHDRHPEFPLFRGHCPVRFFRRVVA